MPLTRYGYGRGGGVDRRLIDDFIAENSDVIQGNCLEIEKPLYLDAHGELVTSVEILDIDARNPKATIIGDLSDLHDVKDDTFDCVILPQTLQYLGRPPDAVAELHRILAPGGTVLVTMPCLAPVDKGLGHDSWRFLPLGVDLMFAEHFGSSMKVEGRGNVLTGMAYWCGLGASDVPSRGWKVNDPDFPLIVTVRATKSR